MTDVAFPDPIQAALSGYSARSRAEVPAYAVSGRDAAVLIVTPEEEWSEYLGACVLTEDGWHDAGGGSATEQWGLTDEEKDTGCLRGWGQSQARAVRVGWAGRTTEVAVSSRGYYVWLLEDVPCPGTPRITELP